MTHKTITVDMVHNFEWYYSREEALKRVRELTRQGIAAYCGGKRAKSKFTYLDLTTAAIYYGFWNNQHLSWIVAW